MSTSKRIFFAILLCLFSISFAQSQVATVIGSTSFYKLTKPGEYSITVNLWGYVRNPGRYEVPSDCDIVQLISFAGGPSNHADLENIKLYRIRPDSGLISKQDLTLVNLEDMLRSKNRPILLQHSDTIILEPTSYPFWMDVLAVFRDVSWIIYSVAVVYQILK
ncbi:MAG: SLBB domain-containing protein [Bacteroidota bacterium]